MVESALSAGLWWAKVFGPLQPKTVKATHPHTICHQGPAAPTLFVDSNPFLLQCTGHPRRQTHCSHRAAPGTGPLPLPCSFLAGKNCSGSIDAIHQALLQICRAQFKGTTHIHYNNLAWPFRYLANSYTARSTAIFEVEQERRSRDLIILAWHLWIQGAVEHLHALLVGPTPALLHMHIMRRGGVLQQSNIVPIENPCSCRSMWDAIAPFAKSTWMVRPGCKYLAYIVSI